MKNHNKHIERDESGKWKNTDLFSPAAVYYNKYGHYPHPNEMKRDFLTKEQILYWGEEHDRCINGYEVDGYKITGLYYFYLNYFPMMGLGEKELKKNTIRKGTQSKKLSFPKFYDVDYDYFWHLEIAKNGIGKEELDRLNLNINSVQRDEDGGVTGGKDMVVLKARRKGHSYKTACLALYYWTFEQHSMTAICAVNDRFSGENYDKIQTAQEFLLGTIFYRRKGRDTKGEMEAFFKEKNELGEDITKGMKSKIKTITFHNNPDALRGFSPALIIYEEAGKFNNLNLAHAININSIHQGSIKTGTAIMFGTGGDMTGKGIESLCHYFYSPHKHNMLSFHNKWEIGNESEVIGYFHPATYGADGCVDEHGNSKIDVALEYRSQEINIKPTEAEKISYIAENPLTPKDAFLSNAENIFPIKLLLDSHNKVKEDFKKAKCVELYRGDNDIVHARVIRHQIAKPITDISEKNGNGCVVIYATPPAKPPPNRYIIGYDPFQSETGESLGASIVYRLSLDPSKITPSNDLSYIDTGEVVAEYIGRPSTSNIYLKNLILLSNYYNAKVVQEKNVDMKPQLDLLGHSYILMEAKFSKYFHPDKSKKHVNTRGVHVDNNVKEKLIQLTNDWLRHPRGSGDNEKSKKRNLHFLRSPRLIHELIHYSYKGNFDACSSFFMVMAGLKTLEVENPARRNTVLQDIFHHSMQIQRKKRNNQALHGVYY